MSILNAFSGTFTPTKVSFPYKFALATVAFAMVLLPIIYISLIGLTGYGVYYHAVHHISAIFQYNISSSIQITMYIGPIIVGLILIFFMVKPFFARTNNVQQEPLSISHTDNPVLFAFIQKICLLVQAPLPSRVDVDCQVNASASFSKGARNLFNTDLVLTIGLPLVAGMNMQQLAGVLAHEFGHFAQGAGMRLTFVIRDISFWFSRVVYERDKWDEKLDAWAEKNRYLIIIVILHMARGCVWLSRRLLWALMMAGNAISCFMLRQMEYDADSYGVKLAGSEAFRTTCSRLHALDISSEATHQDLNESWENRRLPKNLPDYIQRHASLLSVETLQKIDEERTQQKTEIFDTHPSDIDRIHAANALAQPGVFHLTDPANNLFGDFDSLCHQATRFYYEKSVGLTISAENLVASADIFDEIQINTQANQAINQYFGHLNLGWLPISVAASTAEVLLDRQQVATALRESKHWLANNHATHEALLKTVEEQEEKLKNFADAMQLLHAGFQLEAETFGLTTSAWDEVEQKTQAETKSNAAALAQLSCLQQTLAQRLSIALRYHMHCSDTTESHTELLQLIPLQQRLATTLEPLKQLRQLLQSFNTLLENRDPSSNVSELDEYIEKVADELRGIRANVQAQLEGFTYPFAHANGQMSVNRYAEHDQQYHCPWDTLYYDCSTTLDRLFSLYLRTLGRLVVIAAQVEAQLDLPMAGVENLALSSTQELSENHSSHPRQTTADASQ